MKFINPKTSALAIAITGLASSAWAIPTLQLDVVNDTGVPVGEYDPITETVVATSTPFHLRALLDGTTGLTRTYYISAAITPNPGVADFGSFNFDGMEISSANMRYGNPPVDATLLRDPGDLPSHDIFPTYFAEFAFNINLADQVPSYNTQDGSGGSGNLYYVDFDVDIWGLAGQPDSIYAVHFDLYDTLTTRVDIYQGRGRRAVLVSSTTDTDVDHFAPFSHDAESGHGITITPPPPPPPVPDGGTTLLLLGSAMTGLEVFRRKFGVKIG